MAETDEEKLNKLALEAVRIISNDEDKNKKYIAFLERNKLKSSGPTPELLGKFNLMQRKEFVDILKG